MMFIGSSVSDSGLWLVCFGLIALVYVLNLSINIHILN